MSSDQSQRRHDCGGPPRRLARALTATVLLAVVCTALAVVVFLALIREVGPTRAVVLTYVNPAVALRERRPRVSIARQVAASISRLAPLQRIPNDVKEAIKRSGRRE